jgi:hypothetical protein
VAHGKAPETSVVFSNDEMNPNPAIFAFVPSETELAWFETTISDSMTMNRVSAFYKFCDKTYYSI